MLANLVNFMLSLPVLFAVMLLTGGEIAAPALLLPVIIVIESIFILGMVLLLSSISVFYRDTAHIMGVILQLWFFVTPIFYPAELVPPRFRWILDVNPMYYVVEAYRALVMDQRLPDPAHAAALAAMALVAFVAGHWVFRRSKHAFVDVL